MIPHPLGSEALAKAKAAGLVNPPEEPKKSDDEAENEMNMKPDDKLTPDQKALFERNKSMGMTDELARHLALGGGYSTKHNWLGEPHGKPTPEPFHYQQDPIKFQKNKASMPSAEEIDEADDRTDTERLKQDYSAVMNHMSGVAGTSVVPGMG